MPWAAAAIGGGAVIGAYGASQAGDASSGGSKDAIKASQYQTDRTRNDLFPWLQSGGNALNAYNNALGLGGSYANTPLSWNEYIESDLAPSKNRKEAYEGYKSRFDYGDFTPDGGSPAGMDPFSFNLENDDIYNFAQDEGLRAATRRMAQGGHGNSGNILAELQNRSSGIASQYQNDAYGRQLGTHQQNYGQEQNYLNRLQNMSGSGQNAAAQMGGFGANAGANQGNISMQNAANQGQMYQGINNALQGGIGNYLQYDYLNNNPYRGATTASLTGGSTGGNWLDNFNLGGGNL